jgi:hypothetical protein
MDNRPALTSNSLVRIHEIPTSGSVTGSRRIREIFSKVALRAKAKIEVVNWLDPQPQDFSLAKPEIPSF